MIALLTPNFLEGESLTFVASKIIELIKNNNKIYMKDLTKRYKDSFKLGKTEEFNYILFILLFVYLIKKG